jgi:hypothetical protein
MNTIVVIEDRAGTQSHECEAYPRGSALDVLCVCGGRIHPIVGAWCPKCGAKVVQLKEVSKIENRR